MSSNQIILRNSTDVLRLSRGDMVGRKNLYSLIQYSKVKGSEYWAGHDSQVGNTPQQGINWIGILPHCKAVILKSRSGAYKNDGWLNNDESFYEYSFKAVKGKISYTEKANAVLINQPRFHYPVLLLIEAGSAWVFEGSFMVNQIHRDHVILERNIIKRQQINEQLEEWSSYKEGDRKYVTHLLSERNKSVVAEVKKNFDHICDICNMVFMDYYGVDCIEAHHKVPISTFDYARTVNINDFVLLCPNCHRAVHAHMRIKGLTYHEIKQILHDRLPDKINSNNETS